MKLLSISVMLLIFAAGLVRSQDQPPLIAISAPEVDQYKPRGTSKTYVALFGLHIDVRSSNPSNIAKRAGVIYSIDGGKWLAQEAQFSQTTFGSPVQSFAVLVNFTSQPHPAGSIKFAAWVDMGDGSKRWDNNNGEDYFVAFPQPTPEAIIKSVDMEQTFWQCKLNTTTRNGGSYQLIYAFKVHMAPTAATESLNVTYRVSTTDGRIHPWKTHPLHFQETMPVFPLGFGNGDLRPVEIWVSDPRNLAPYHSKSPFDEIQYYYEAISNAAPRKNDLHRLRAPEDYAQTFSAKINPFADWSC